ncbi:ribonuclease H protein [Pyrus ussuriensis x Pyrus communis]|uniref:Ribonuclease H protein n=1 Tax=Pyrus ussuriensis x Pyrus communis TaxID=2448454 RepID=A0A5N5F2D1_9ROSA|nr:ribonuclease H protein [Pyrus ussuriensis x Pyrus communis]
MADDWVRVTVDGATKLQAHVGGAGAMIRDAHGGFVAAMACFLPNRGIGLTAWRDYSQSVSIVNSCVDRASVMDLLAGDFISITRNNNGVAHCLAKVAVSSGTCMFGLRSL